MNRTVPGALCAILVFAFASCPAAVADDSTGAQAEVLKVEAEFSAAKMHNDVAALDRILADEYIGINQWGARRDKKSALELFKSFQTTSLEQSHVKVRVAGDVAIIDGVLDESKQWKFLFMRTYVRRQGQWRLLSSVHTFPLNTDMTSVDLSRFTQ